MAEIAVVETREVILALYRGLFGREPSTAEVDHQVDCAAKGDMTSVVAAFLGSPEYKRMTAAKPPGFAAMNYEPGNSVETQVPPADLDRLWGHVAAVWASLGKADPLWSVLTEEQLRGSSLDDTALVDDFYAGGVGDLNYLKAFLQRAGRRVEDFPTVAEYGCGVGRVTAWLAREFRQVRGYDISAPHAAACRSYLAKQHLDNASIHLLGTRAELARLTDFDLFVSIIVLQHNPPPIILDILKHAFLGLNPNGLAVFQVPIYERGYRFDQASYWAGLAANRAMEMHCVPQRDILALADQCGLVPLEIRNDHCTGRFGDAISSTFVLRKR